MKHGRAGLDPGFDVDWSPVLWGAIPGAFTGVFIMLAGIEPIVLVLAGAVAGTVAGVRSDFYAQISLNGLVAATIAFLCAVPLIVDRQARIIGAELPMLAFQDVLFFAISRSLFEVVIYGPIAAVLGYLAATAVEVIRLRRKAAAD